MEFLKRLCERNQCKVAEVMSADVNYVVTSAGHRQFRRAEKRS